MQSSMLITYNDCTYSWATLLERGAVPHFPALWGRRAGGRWMALLIGHSFYQSDASNETTAHNGGCQSENVGEQRGISLSNIPLLSSLLQCLNLLQSDRERGLSVLMKAYLPDTEYTPLPTQGVEAFKWLTKRHTPSTSNPGQNCRLVWVILALWHHSAERCHDSPNPHHSLISFSVCIR